MSAPISQLSAEVCKCSYLTLCIDEILEIPNLVETTGVAQVYARPLAMNVDSLHFSTVYDRKGFVEILCQLNFLFVF